MLSEKSSWENIKPNLIVEKSVLIFQYALYTRKLGVVVKEGIHILKKCMRIVLPYS